jgi:DNA repair protein RecO (recombination protein O)
LRLEEGEPEEERLRMFEIRMLSLFGYRPNLKRCDICKKDWEDLQGALRLFFSPEKGAMVCEGCSKMSNRLIPLSLGTARLVEQISQIDLPKIHRLKFTPQALNESRELLSKFITYQLGKELKSLRVMSKHKSKHEIRSVRPPVPWRNSKQARMIKFQMTQTKRNRFEF